MFSKARKEEELLVKRKSCKFITVDPLKAEGDNVLEKLSLLFSECLKTQKLHIVF